MSSTVSSRATQQERASAMSSSPSLRSSSSSSATPHGFLKEEQVKVTSRSGLSEYTRYQFHCQCGKAYRKRKFLVEHVRCQQTGRLFRCQLCNKSYNTNKQLKKHLIGVHGHNPGETFGCHGCGKQFDSYEKLMDHRKLAQHPVVKLKKPDSPLPKGQQTMERFFTPKAGE